MTRHFYAVFIDKWTPTAKIMTCEFESCSFERMTAYPFTPHSGGATVAEIVRFAQVIKERRIPEPLNQFTVKSYR